MQNTQKILFRRLQFAINNFPTKKISSSGSFTGEFYHTLKDEITANLYKLLQKVEEEEHILTHGMRPPSPRYQNLKKK